MKAGDILETTILVLIIQKHSHSTGISIARSANKAFPNTSQRLKQESSNCYSKREKRAQQRGKITSNLSLRNLVQESKTYRARCRQGRIISHRTYTAYSQVVMIVNNYPGS